MGTITPEFDWKDYEDCKHGASFLRDVNQIATVSVGRNDFHLGQGGSVRDNLFGLVLAGDRLVPNLNVAANFGINLLEEKDSEFCSSAPSVSAVWAEPLFGKKLSKLRLVDIDVSKSVDRFLDKLESKQDSQFWARWYRGFLDGTPIDWEVQYEIAKRPIAEWRNGSSAVAQRIAEIEARINLQRRIDELEQALLPVDSRGRGIGDNNPPSAIEGIDSAPLELANVFETLGQIREETRSEKPDVRRVQASIDVLKRVAAACGAWTWEKTNVAVDAGLKAGAAAATVAYVTGHGDKIVAVIKAAIEWLKLLP